MEFSWITPELAVGGRIQETQVYLLREYGIDRVIDLRAEGKDDAEALRQHGVELLHLPTLDLHAVSQEMLWQGVSWASSAMRAGKKVLAHCEHGIGRSALLALCTLVNQGHHPLEALRLAKSKRTPLSPSPEQLHAYLHWIRDWHERQCTNCPPVTWDELAAIAYNHDCVR